MSWGVATQNGVSVSLTSIVSLSAGVTEFSPADLFTGGVQGAWYDPSDVLLNWRTNLLTYSQEFDNAAWSKFRCTISQNATTAPDGTTTADATAQISGQTTIGVVAETTSGFIGSTPVTIAVYGKLKEKTFLALGTDANNVAGNNSYSYFNLSTGAVSFTASGHTATISNAGNGWYLCIVTVTTRAAGGNVVVVFGGADTSNSTTVTDSGGIYIWGAQLELGSTATAYQAITTPEQTYLLYDPQPVLFQDSAGTTPVTAVEQPVGLMLDKSQGLVLGSELNDGLDVLANWTVFGTNTVAADGDAIKVTYVTNAFGAYSLLQAAKGLSTNLTVGQWYKVTGQAKVNTGSANVVINTSTTWTSSAITSTSYVDFTIYFLCDNATTNYIAFSNLQTGEEIWIRGVSVKSLAGNHASQATAASRPVLRARYNLLTYSEQFDNAAWTKANATVTANAASAPDGTLTADTLIDDGTNGRHSLNQNPTLVASAPYTLSLYVKAGTGRYVTLSVSRVAAGSTYYAARYDLQTSTVTATAVSGSTTHIASSITNVGSGWYRCDLTGILSTFTDAVVMVSGAINPTGFGDRGAEVYVGSGFTWLLWGADLRTGSSAGTYQRIAAATDYATAGFLPYLALDGTDDSFGTNSINFSATDKMSVCAGVTKLSDAAQGVIVELSGDPINLNGVFLANAPQAANEYFFRSKGTIPESAVIDSATYAAPITNVMAGIGDISGDVVALRLNGSQVASSTGDQGTGNYGNYPLYIGRRNNATLPFNGRIYQMVICGKTLSAAELASTEAYVNRKTGAY